MPNARETQTRNLPLLGKTPYLPPNLFTGGKDHELVRSVFDRLCHPVRVTPSGLALEDFYYMVEAKYLNDDNALADIWQVTGVTLLNEWQAQVTLTKVAHLHNNVLSPIPDSTVRAKILRTMGRQAITAATLKRP